MISITTSRFAAMFPRLVELKDADPNPTHPDTYFQHLAERLENEHIRYVYGQIERSLGVLDAEAWRDLKERALPLLTVRDEKRGWRDLFDTLNEAKGYAFLRCIGCTEVSFIKRQEKRTPDLRAMLVRLCHIIGFAKESASDLN